MRNCEKLLGQFDLHTKQLLSTAGSIARQRGHRAVDAYHFLLAWLTDTGSAPASVNAALYDCGIDYLVKRGPEIAFSSSLHLSALFIPVFNLAIKDADDYIKEDKVGYQWIIPNLLTRRTVAQVVMVCGADLVRFLSDLLDMLEDPFPRLFDHYLGRLDVVSLSKGMNIVLHRPDNE